MEITINTPIYSGDTARPAELTLLPSAAREQGLSRLLSAYILTGLVFMLLPGTFLGVWNLLTISGHREANRVSAAWIQAHGHAQIFGWLGSFILGIGFYSIPKLRRITAFALSQGYVCWTLWTAGVALRWFAGVYLWHWRETMPFAAGLELMAFLIFFRAVAGHRPAGESASSGKRGKFETWVIVVICATVGFLAALAMSFGESVNLAIRGAGPAFPPGFDQRFLLVCVWASLVPFVWGFSARWLPVFLGLQKPRPQLLLLVLGLDLAGIAAGLLGWHIPPALLFFASAVAAPVAIGLTGPAKGSKVRGVSPSFPAFVRIAYAWLGAGSILGIWAAANPAYGITGASRHAVTVGFLATMVFSIGPRVLPAFSGLRLLFSTRLMFISLAMLTAGCALRVISEIVAYQHYGEWAWKTLPISAVIELSAVTLFALNLAATLATKPIVPAAASTQKL